MIMALRMRPQPRKRESRRRKSQDIKVPVPPSISRASTPLQVGFPFSRSLPLCSLSENVAAGGRPLLQADVEQAPEEAPAPAESMSGAVDSVVLDSFQCPFTMEVMRDPVITVDGQTYERTEIEEWFALGNRTSPLTGEALLSTNLFPNIALRKAIRESGLL
jgi:hypothetical protein